MRERNFVVSIRSGLAKVAFFLFSSVIFYLFIRFVCAIRKSSMSHTFLFSPARAIEKCVVYILSTAAAAALISTLSNGDFV